MLLKPFKLERYFAEYEFTSKYLLSASDCDGLSQRALLEMADEEMKRMWDDLTLGYTNNQGLPLLRSEIVKLYKNISSTNILITAPEEGIFIALNTLLAPGDHVISVFPSYQSLYEIPQSLGCEVTRWLPEKNLGWRFNPEFLRNNIKNNTKLIIINFPHNPTGSLPSQEEFTKIISIAKEKGIYILSDEMYRLFEFDISNRLPAICDVYDKGISLSGMSKTFGMAGVRIGWLITKDKDLFAKMQVFKDYTTVCSSAPSEILSVIALRVKGTIIQKHINRLRGNLALLDDFFGKYHDFFDFVRPKGGSVCFPKLLKNVSAVDFCQKSVIETGILLLPSGLFDYNDNHIRIGFGRENMPEVLSKFEEFVKKVFNLL